MRAVAVSTISGCRSAWMSTRNWARNSTSTCPPAACLRFQRFAFALLRRDGPAHVENVAGDAAGITRTGEHLQDHLLHPPGKGGAGRDDPRPGQRHVLPGPGLGALVILERADARRHRAGAAGRAQAQVHVIELAGIGEAGQRGDEALGEAGEILRSDQRARAVRRAVRGRIEIVEHDEIEVGAGGHLAAAELAHGEHRRIRAGNAAVRLHEARPDAGVQGADDDLRHAGIGLARPRRRQRAGDDAHADQNVLFLPEAAGAVELFFLIGAASSRLRDGRRGPARRAARRRRRIEQRIGERRGAGPASRRGAGRR